MSNALTGGHASTTLPPRVVTLMCVLCVWAVQALAKAYWEDWKAFHLYQVVRHFREMKVRHRHT